MKYTLSKKTMKVIFLDIDGVLNNIKTAQRHRGAIGIDPYLVSHFNRIIFATDAKIVISSSWRYWKDGLEEIRRCVMDFYDITPKDNGSKERGYEIKEWLQFHPEVTKYAIIDDNSDMLPDQMKNFFKTCSAYGLTEEIAQKVINHLKS